MVIGQDEEQYFQLGSQLPPLEKVELVKFSQANIDVFAWSTYNVPSSKKHVEVVRVEVNKLKQVGAIKEIFYPEWLANTMVIKKKNGKWRVCVDFIDLNKVRPKDPFPISKINQLVDATIGHPKMSFLDAFQEYHQIPLSLSDQEKTAFRAPNGNYHYWVMLFGLKSAGSTYQRMVMWMFESQIVRNMKAYIDDMVIKSRQVEEHLVNLGEVFSMLKEDKLCLNASKCSFGASSGKFLGYMITHRGIEVNLD